jgi:hypothetical protein
MKKRIIIATLCFLALFWLWPNLVHEPLHLLALKLQGSNGQINWDWSYPATPSITRTEPVVGVLGGLFFLLLPSIISVGLIVWAVATRHSAAILTHLVLPTYLMVDLFINVSRHNHSTSDYFFLTALHPFIVNALIMFIVIFGLAALFVIVRSQTPAKQINAKPAWTQ